MTVNVCGRYEIQPEVDIAYGWLKMQRGEETPRKTNNLSKIQVSDYRVSTFLGNVEPT